MDCTNFCPDKMRLFHNACNKNILTDIKSFVKEGYPVNSRVDSSFGEEFTGYTPLHFAVKNRSKPTMMYLLQNGADITAQSADSRTPVHLAFYNLADALVSTLFECSTTDTTYTNVVDKTGLTHFHVCCSLNVPAVETFIKQGVNLDAAVSLLSDNDYSGWTSLHFAVERNRPIVINLLFENNANPNIKCGKGLTPLHLACKASRVSTIELLLTLGANVNAKDNEGRTPLHSIVKQRACPDIIKLLMENGASIHEPDFEGETPFDLAVKNRKYEAVETMSTLCNNVNQKPVSFATAFDLSSFHIACHQDNLDAIKLFVRHGYQINSHAGLSFDESYRGYTPLHFAVNNRSESTMIYLLENGADITLKNEEGCTPVHQAYYNRSEYLLPRLFERSKINTYVDVTDNKGLTHFHVCCASNIPVLEEFIISGANVNSSITGLGQDDSGYTPLHFAVKVTNTSTISLLLQHGAHHGLRDGSGLTPLHIACDLGDAMIVQMLLTYGADVNVRDNGGRTSLHFAVKNGKEDIMINLLNNGTDITQKNEDGCTPVHQAYYMKFEHLLPIMFEHSKINTYVDVADYRGLTHFHICCALNVPVLEEFIKSGANVNSSVTAPGENDSGYTPLHFAVKTKDTLTVSLLLQNGANHGLADESGLTPLHIASELGDVLSVDVLMEYGADFTLIDNSGRTALHWAFGVFGNKEIADLFSSKIPQSLIDETIGTELEVWEQP